MIVTEDRIIKEEIIFGLLDEVSVKLKISEI